MKKRENPISEPCEHGIISLDHLTGQWRCSKLSCYAEWTAYQNEQEIIDQEYEEATPIEVIHKVSGEIARFTQEEWDIISDLWAAYEHTHRLN